MKKNIPSWPEERSLARYKEFTLLDFNEILSNGDMWIDIGCRSGKALSQLSTLRKVKLVGVNAHKITVLPGIEPIYTVIPDDITLYKKYRKQARLVTDIHGAISYAENPLHALIYEALLLKPGGTAVLVTMEERFGEVTTWERITSFFKLKMQQNIVFEKFNYYSEHVALMIRSVRIIITGYCDERNNLDSLLVEARKYVGVMRKNILLLQAEDKSFEIWQVIYDLLTKIK